ncbi:MAG: hypothetical protein LBF24_03775 [Puniceicoccales bacterium]|jgi:hypothetical protein|nr:hypothetical protein [Puniceicoccales bacterium]
MGNAFRIGSACAELIRKEVVYDGELLTANVRCKCAATLGEWVLFVTISLVNLEIFPLVHHIANNKSVTRILQVISTKSVVQSREALKSSGFSTEILDNLLAQVDEDNRVEKKISPILAALVEKAGIENGQFDSPIMYKGHACHSPAELLIAYAIEGHHCGGRFESLEHFNQFFVPRHPKSANKSDEGCRRKPLYELKLRGGCVAVDSAALGEVIDFIHDAGIHLRPRESFIHNGKCLNTIESDGVVGLRALFIEAAKRDNDLKKLEEAKNMSSALIAMRIAIQLPIMKNRMRKDRVELDAFAQKILAYPLP